MELYSQKSEYKLYHGNMLDMGQVIEDWTIDSVITDPPYELNFMWKGWDNSWIAFQKETREKCLKALKPWGYLLAFGGSRTYHRIACAIEDAGFEIRDCIMRIYWSGFPKSMNLWKSIESKLLNGTANPKDFKDLDGEKVETWNWWISKMVKEQWARPSDYTEDKHLRVDKVNYKTELWKKYEGRWTALKPSYEPIIVARKPLEWSCTDNVIKYGVGGINIDECRVGTETHKVNINDFSNQHGNKFGNGAPIAKLGEKEITGRFPANTILTYWEEDKEEVISWFPYTKSTWGSWIASQINTFKNVRMWANWKNTWANLGWLWDEWSAARYFYCAKASKRDRDEGLDEFEEKDSKSFMNSHNWHWERIDWAPTPQRKNTHPTVKPTDLMQYLVRLVTPNGWTVLDPFNWSGSTGKAVMYENKDRNKNYKYIWIELTEEYLPIAKARIEYVINKWTEIEKSDPKQEEEVKQRKESALF